MGERKPITYELSMAPIDIYATPPAIVQFVEQSEQTPGVERMWKLETRKRLLKYQHTDRQVWLDSLTLVRDDGVSIMSAGDNTAHQLKFIYSDKEVSFDFLASRFVQESREPTDTWTVLLGAALNGLENTQGKVATAEKGSENRRQHRRRNACMADSTSRGAGENSGESSEISHKHVAPLVASTWMGG